MNRKQFLTYIPGVSFIHRMTGTSKLIFFIFVSVSSMITFDTRFLLSIGILSLILLKLSGIKYRDIRFVTRIVFVFAVLNLTAVYLFQPTHGEVLYGSRTVLFGRGYLTFTAEQGFYMFNLALKYFVTLPLALLFVLTTSPSEFASSLNSIGVSYKVAYSVALALRYIPDIQDEFFDITHAQQARGYEMSKKASLLKRLKGIAQIIFPLIFVSLEKIDTVTTAMELRRFGKLKKRTWYMYRPMTKYDAFGIISAIVILGVCIWLFYVNGGRFYNPFL